jgi:general secretion pathway protein C
MRLQKAALAVTLAALAFLGVVLAYWSWVWFAPSAVPRAPAAVQLAGRASAAGGLFGTAQQGSGAAATGSGALRLMGVMAAAAGEGGRALLRLDGKRSLAVFEGEDIVPGLRLAEVHVDHIVLERNGVRETLALPEKSGK